MAIFVAVKRIIVILLLILYSASTIGASINMHYCMNKFASWSLSSEKKEKCATCGMTNSGCCKDEKKQFKLSLDQQKTEGCQNINTHSPAVVKGTTVYNINKFVVMNKQNPAYFHTPPLILKKNPQAFFATFLI